jgi:uncharacterized protein YjbJ (UPF0337 family)
MGAEDKASNKIEDLGGKAKEALGKVTGDKDTENEGKVDQAKSSLKDAGEKIKYVFKNLAQISSKSARRPAWVAGRLSVRRQCLLKAARGYAGQTAVRRSGDPRGSNNE